MIYNLIKQGRQKVISQACRVLQVSRSGYYTAKRRAEQSVSQPVSQSASQPVSQSASQPVIVQVKVAFVANQHCYVSRRAVRRIKGAAHCYRSIHSASFNARSEFTAGLVEKVCEHHRQQARSTRDR